MRPVAITEPVCQDPQLFRRLTIAHSVRLRDDISLYFDLLPRYAALGDSFRVAMCQRLLQNARDELERFGRASDVHAQGTYDHVPF